MTLWWPNLLRLEGLGGMLPQDVLLFVCSEVKQGGWGGGGGGGGGRLQLPQPPCLLYQCKECTFT